MAPYSASDEIQTLMNRDVIVIGPDDDLIMAAAKMHEQGVGALPVVEDGMKIIGILTERDICRELGKGCSRLEHVLVKDAMSSALVYVQPEETLDGVIARMSDYHYRRIPVVKNDQLVGIVSQTDFLNHYPELISSHSW